MNDKFDQLAKGVAQSVTRRQAFRRFGLGLATIAMAGFGFNALATNKCIPSGTPCDDIPGTGHSCDKCCSGFEVGNGTGKFVCQ